MSDKKPQKTQLLTDAPPEVQAAIDRQSQQQQQPSGQATMLLDAPNAQAAVQQQGGRQVVVPTMMKQRPTGGLPPVKRKKKSTVGRWIAGPLISLGVAAGTAAVANALMPLKPKETAPAPKVMGKIALDTEPAGASVTIDGKPFPHFTPTEVEGEVGATLKIGFKLDGYQSKDEEVVVSSAGVHPFKVKLDKLEAAPPAPAAPEPATSAHHDHHEKAIAHAVHEKEPVGKGTISVFVRPWAIVFVDGTRLRQTPVTSYEIPSGKHTLKLVNDPKGKKEEVPIMLKPGESQEIRRDWDK